MPVPLLLSAGEDLREFALANSLAAQQGGPGSRLLSGVKLRRVSWPASTLPLTGESLFEFATRTPQLSRERTVVSGQPRFATPVWVPLSHPLSGVSPVSSDLDMQFRGIEVALDRTLVCCPSTRGDVLRREVAW